MSTLRHKLRPLQLLRQQLQHLHDRRMKQRAHHIDRVSDAVQRFGRLARQMTRAHEFNWHAAAARRLEQVLYTCDQLRLDLGNLPRFTDTVRSPFLPTLRELWDDLDQLEEEFAGWKFDLTTASLSAVTEAIELEDVDLGRFLIRLDLRELPWLDDRRPYRVIALDARPADGHDDVVHPHVTGQQLCEGEASSAIRSCLESGRLTDFFLVVRSVLRTYNRSSAYVQLDEWTSPSCPECGSRMPESSSCEQCRDEVCDDCIIYCRPCEGHYCPSCVVSCSECERAVCRQCLHTCRACGARRCLDCLEDDLCGECRERIEDDPDDITAPDALAAETQAVATAPQARAPGAPGPSDASGAAAAGPHGQEPAR